MTQWAVATFGLPAIWGVLSVALFADGRWVRAGTGWGDGVCGRGGQGVSGWLVATGLQPAGPVNVRATDRPGCVAHRGLLLPWLIFKVALSVLALGRRIATCRQQSMRRWNRSCHRVGSARGTTGRAAASAQRSACDRASHGGTCRGAGATCQRAPCSRCGTCPEPRRSRPARICGQEENTALAQTPVEEIQCGLPPLARTAAAARRYSCSVRARAAAKA